MKKVFFIFLLVEVLLIAAFAATPNYAAARQACPPDRVCLINPLGFVGVNTPGELVIKAFQGFAGIIAAVAIAFTVFSGFKLIIATSEESIKSARQSLVWSIGGFVVALLSFSIIAAAGKFLGFEPSKVDLGGDTLGPVLRLRTGDPTQFVDVMNFVMVNFLALIGFATTLMIIYYGYKYITAAGNEDAITQAKTGLKWAILGLVVTLLAYTIIAAVRWYLVFGAPS